MSTANSETGEAVPVVNVAIEGMHRCKRCELNYVLNKSTSALKLTYCSFLCELGDLGFSMAGLEAMERAPVSTPPPSEPEAIAIQ